MQCQIVTVSTHEYFAVIVLQTGFAYGHDCLCIDVHWQRLRM